MAIYTNMTSHLINTASGTMMLPSFPTEVSDEDAANARFQEMVTAEEIAAGEPPVVEGETKPAPKTSDVTPPAQTEAPAPTPQPLQPGQYQPAKNQ